MPTNRLTDIVRGRRGVTADTAHRLGTFFGTSPQFWVNLQALTTSPGPRQSHDYSTIRRFAPV